MASGSHERGRRGARGARGKSPLVESNYDVITERHPSRLESSVREYCTRKMLCYTGYVYV